MNIWQIATRSFRHYLRSDVAIALGVAAATAVLTGALIVGDSMRSSLHGLTMERLGAIDELLISEGFFRAELAEEIKNSDTFKEHYQNATPAIVFPGGTVEYQPDDVARRAGQVGVLGITDDFWNYDTSEKLSLENLKGLAGETAIINQALADDLQISTADVDSGQVKITVRVPKQTQLPADSALGRKTDLIESLVDLKVVQIVPTAGLGRFGLVPSQADPLNVYVPLELLQNSLQRTVLKHKSDPAQVNVLLLGSKSETPPGETISKQLRSTIRPSLADYGLVLKRVKQTFEAEGKTETVFDYWSLSSDKLVLTEEAVDSIATAFPGAEPVFTYLANDIRKSGQASGVPFSMVSAIDFGKRFRPVSAQTNEPIRALGENEIVLNQWAANDIGATIGDEITMTFFEPETTHGSQLESSARLNLIDIVGLTEPEGPFVFNRRQGLSPATFASAPTIVNDPDLTPEVPGVTDAESIENWDLPFETAGKIRAQDDDYWSFHRTTPKGFVSLATGRRLWDSRFGVTTSFRIPSGTQTADELATKLLDQFAADEARLGMHIVPLKRQALAASSGSTPFDVLFLALSMFVIGAALILVSLLFRLAFQQRAGEVGVLMASGFDQKRIRKLWLGEMSIVSLVGAIGGVALGVGYAWAMIWGLTHWWVGAISRPFLEMHVSPLSLIAGLISGLLICVLTIAWSLRRTRRLAVRNLLAGQLESDAGSRQGSLWSRYIPVTLIVLAIGLAVMATQLAGEAQAGSFMGAGFVILAALLMLVYHWLSRPSDIETTGKFGLVHLAVFNAKRNPLRSTLTIGLVAVASFLIAAVSSFRLSPSQAGTAGFDWVAQSSQPIFDLSGPDQSEAANDVTAIRFKSGEDASCNNLYQSTKPRALGIPDHFFDSFDSAEQPQFAWGGSLAKTESEKQNPWQLLKSEVVHQGTAEDPIPVVLDKNTANYSLKIYLLGTVKRVDYDSGESIHYRVVGFLANTILQGSLVMSERDFENAFPNSAGYQYFLIRDGIKTSEPDSVEVVPGGIAKLEDRYSDQGFDARSAPKLLANFMAVQNTYLSTFQTLGALGLLLGTFGLTAVQIRGVFERKKELSLMRAVGFNRGRLAKMILLENAWLLLMGLAVGIAAALFTTVPHWLLGAATIPWRDLAILFTIILLIGLIASWLGSRAISRMPLLESLRT